MDSICIQITSKRNNTRNVVHFFQECFNLEFAFLWIVTYVHTHQDDFTPGAFRCGSPVAPFVYYLFSSGIGNKNQPSLLLPSAVNSSLAPRGWGLYSCWSQWVLFVVSGHVWRRGRADWTGLLWWQEVVVVTELVVDGRGKHNFTERNH